MEIRAVGNRVILHPLPLDFKPKNEHQKMGRLVAVGEEAYSGLDVGMDVYYDDSESVDIVFEGEDLVLVWDDDIFAAVGFFEDEADVEDLGHEHFS